MERGGAPLASWGLGDLQGWNLPLPAPEALENDTSYSQHPPGLGQKLKVGRARHPLIGLTARAPLAPGALGWEGDHDGAGRGWGKGLGLRQGGQIGARRQGCCPERLRVTQPGYSGQRLPFPPGDRSHRPGAWACP